MNNTRQRSVEIANAARALLIEYGAALDQPVPFATLVPQLVERVGCHSSTAKRHLAKAARQLRGEEATNWGGARPGAGRPASK